MTEQEQVAAVKARLTGRLTAEMIKVGMRIRHQQSGRSATISRIELSLFAIVFDGAPPPYLMKSVEFADYPYGFEGLRYFEVLYD